MGNFSNITVTDAGRQLINQAIGAGQQVNIVNSQVGSGYPAAGDDPDGYSQLVHFVADASSSSANDQVLYQTTVRISVSSGTAPYQFQLNEIGVFAQVGTGPVTLFAYASSQGQGDIITPDPNPSPVVYQYALLIQYESDSPVTATVTLQPVIELHAATHRGNGVDPIGVADATASGSLAQTPGNATQIALGTSPQSWGPIPKHAPTHLDNGIDPIPVATTLRTGLVPILSGNLTDSLAGNGTWQNRAIPPGVMWDFAGATAPTGWLFCNGSLQLIATYPSLYGVLGTTFGGDGVTTFGIPDCRGRTVIGAGAGSGLTSRALGAKGGEEAHVLSVAELAAHNHPFQDNGHVHPVNEGTGHTHLTTDNGHVHSGNDGAGHIHNTTENPHTHGTSDNGHIHNFSVIPTANVQIQAGGPGALINDYPGDRLDGNLVKSARSNIGILNAVTGLGINVAHVAINIANAVTNLAVNSAKTGIQIASQVTGIVIQATGNSAAHNTMMPFVAVNKIIKV